MVGSAIDFLAPESRMNRKPSGYFGQDGVVRHIFSPDPSAVAQRLAAMRKNPIFSRSPRLYMLLEFLVGEAAEGRGSRLKEKFIGETLYRRDQPFDSRTDSSVRVEAARLRCKLEDYNEGPGCIAPFQIMLPRRRYCPVFVTRRSDVRSLYGVQTYSADRPLDLLVMPFRTLGANGLCNTLCDELTDRIISRIGLYVDVKILPKLVTDKLKREIYPLQDVIRLTGAGLFLFGTVRRVGERLRLTAELLDRRGVAIWSRRIEADAADGLGGERDLVHEILSAIPRDIAKMAISSGGGE